MKNQNGITLIALVITIIVLIILAGVAIAMLSGDNGILNKATQAANTYDQKDLEEATKLAIGEIMTNSLGLPTGGFTTTNLTTELIQKQNNNLKNVAVTDDSDNDGYLKITSGSADKIRTVYVSESTGAVYETVPTDDEP